MNVQDPTPPVSGIIDPNTHEWLGDPMLALYYALSMAPVATLIVLLLMTGGATVYFLQRAHFKDLHELIAELWKRTGR